MVNVLPGKFPETRDSIQNGHLFGTTISSQVQKPPEGIVITDSERVVCVFSKDTPQRGTIQYSAISSKEDKPEVFRASLKRSDQHVSSAA